MVGYREPGEVHRPEALTQQTSWPTPICRCQVINALMESPENKEIMFILVEFSAETSSLFTD